MRNTTTGTRISGLILCLSGVLTLGVAFLGYVYFTFMSAMFFSGSGKLGASAALVLPGAWLGSVLVHLMGQAMMRAGDYLLGEFGGMAGKAVLQTSLCHLLKDVCVVQAGLCAIGCALFFFSGNMVAAAAFAAMLVAFSVGFLERLA